MNSLSIRDVRLNLEGVAGVRVKYGSRTLCIDTANVYECDYLLYTHHHTAHYPGDSIIETLGDSVVILSPLKGLRVKPGDVVKLDNYIVVNVIDAYEEDVKAEVLHPRGSGVGYLIALGNETILYHMGDTDLINEILSLKTRIHVLFTPIDGIGVMTAEEAVEAIKSLKPSITIPVHYRNRSVFHKFRDMAQPYTQVVDLKRRW